MIRSAPRDKATPAVTREVILDLVEYRRPLLASDPLGYAAEMIKKNSALNCIPDCRFGQTGPG